ncbi:MAG: Uma2 family endonuclease [Chloroflexota bacterium]
MTLQAKFHTVTDFEQFIAQPENRDRRFELIHGTIVEKSMPTEEHGLIVARLVAWLLAFVEANGLGRVVVETAYRKDADTLNRRILDISFTNTERAGPVVKRGAVPQMPDLAIEVKSPDDTYAEMREKASYYLNSGVNAVWLIFPDVQRIEVYSGEGVTVHEVTDTLHGGDVLPNFSLTISKLFA